MNEYGFEILSTSITDLKDLMSLEQVCFQKSDQWMLFDYIGVLSISDIIRLKAVKDDEMIGFVAIEVRKRQGFAQVMTIGVHPDHRGMGVGSELMKKAESFLPSPIRIELIVRLDNHIAQAMYKKFGYQEKENIPRYYGDRSTGLKMEKFI